MSHAEPRLSPWSRHLLVQRVLERWDATRPDSTTWTYLLEPVAGATRVQHSYVITRLPPG